MLYIIALHGCCIYYKLKVRPSISKKMMTCFIVINSLYYGALEPNLQYLRGMPVILFLVFISNSFFKYILFIILLQLSQFFSPLYPSSILHRPPHSPALSPLSSCPWVVHVSSLASLFPTLFLTSPHLFYAY